MTAPDRAGRRRALHRRLERRSGDLLDDAPSDPEPTVAVAPELAGRRLLIPVAGPGDVPRQRVVALPGVLEPVPLQPTRVGEQMAQRDRRRGRGVGQHQIRQIGTDWGVEVEHAFLDQPHDHGRGEDLAVGADLEEGVGAGRVVRLQADDAVAVRLDLAIVEDGDRHAGDVPFRHGVANHVVQRLLFCRFARSPVVLHRCPLHPIQSWPESPPRQLSILPARTGSV